MHYRTRNRPDGRISAPREAPASQSARAAGTFEIGGDLVVNRLGFGAVRIVGPGNWGEPTNPGEARRVLRRAVELGVTLIDTADQYGGGVSERLIGETLHPYPEDLVVATKSGVVRTGPNPSYQLNGRPEHLRAACEASLRRLKLERVDLYQLHRVDPEVPLEESAGALSELREEGKVRHVGLSEVEVGQIERARKIVPIASVQNRFNLADRRHEAVLDYCGREEIAFLPWNPLATGELGRPGRPLKEIASNHEATPGQVALAWLLRRSPVILPIPGTSSVAHLEKNVAGPAVKLSDAELAALTWGADSG